jgi:5-methylcytosine-specific restriction enzyme subunit McrC
LAVLDTKYKREPKPSADDVAQVVAYATRKACKNAVLIYPRTLDAAKDFYVGGVRVRSLGFPLDADLEEGGMRLLAALGGPERAEVPAPSALGRYPYAPPAAAAPA